MARYVVQSLATGKFLAPGDDGQPEWVVSLRDGLAGMVGDTDHAWQLVRDWCEPEDLPQLVNLDEVQLL
jgi:hypothetical protein